MEGLRLTVSVHAAGFLFSAVIIYGFLGVNSDPAMVRDGIYYGSRIALSLLSALVLTVACSAAFFTARYAFHRVMSNNDS